MFTYIVMVIGTGGKLLPCLMIIPIPSKKYLSGKLV
jgi:hypothetical protein